jgi:uncharacterized protein
MTNNPWYSEGVRFKCTGCGKCCTGPKGYIWISREEIEPLAKHLKISFDAFIAKYAKVPTKSDLANYPNKEALKAKYLIKEVPSQSAKGDYDCIFLSKEGACTIYNFRPKQCKTYPYWPDIMRSKRAWANERRFCEGIEHADAPVIAFASIEKNLTEQIDYENADNPGAPV